MELDFYTIDSSYVAKLQDVQEHVRNNLDRKYIGVVLELNGIKYYVPLCSPKPKMHNWANKMDVYLLDNGKYGFLDFANMLPVPDRFIYRFSINNVTDLKYKSLLQRQKRIISNLQESEIIFKKANKVWKRKIREKEKFNYCLDFKKMESVYRNNNI